MEQDELVFWAIGPLLIVLGPVAGIAYMVLVAAMIP